MFGRAKSGNWDCRQIGAMHCNTHWWGGFGTGLLTGSAISMIWYVLFLWLS